MVATIAYLFIYLFVNKNIYMQSVVNGCKPLTTDYISIHIFIHEYFQMNIFIYTIICQWLQLLTTDCIYIHIFIYEYIHNQLSIVATVDK